MYSPAELLSCSRPEGCRWPRPRRTTCTAPCARSPSVTMTCGSTTASQQPSGRSCIAPLQHDHVHSLFVVFDDAPDPHALAGNRRGHLVETPYLGAPFRRGDWADFDQIACVHRPGLFLRSQITLAKMVSATRVAKNVAPSTATGIVGVSRALDQSITLSANQPASSGIGPARLRLRRSLCLADFHVAHAKREPPIAWRGKPRPWQSPLEVGKSALTCRLQHSKKHRLKLSWLAAARRTLRNQRSRL